MIGLNDLDELMVRADGDAARAAQSWLAAAGLVDELKAIATLYDVDDPTALSELERLHATADDSAAGAHDGATKVRIAIESVGVEDDTHVLALADRGASDAIEGWMSAALACRLIAQRGLGITTFTDGDDRIMRLERACVAVLHPPLDFTEKVDLIDDMPEERAFDVSGSRNNVAIDVAGLVCRLLMDDDIGLQFDTDAGHVRLHIGRRGSLVATLRTTRTDTTKLKAEGWRAKGSDWTAKWAQPVRVSEPTSQALTALLGEDDGETCTLHISAEYLPPRR